MFTPAGKQIVSKYLLGQTPAFGSYIAIGCGVKPITALDTPLDATNKHSLTFETTRAKIISRGYVNDGNSTNMVLTAELPTDERYAITEIGLYPSQMNDSAGALDSKVLLKFNESESWISNNGGTPASIPVATQLNSDTLHLTTINGSAISSPYILSVSSNDVAFVNTTRVERLEVPRFLTRSIMVRGSNDTQIIKLTGLNIDLSKNSPGDYIKFAYSIISDVVQNDNFPTNPSDNYTIKIKFLNNSVSETEYFQLQTTLSDATSTSRYQVISKQIKDLTAHGTNPTLSGIIAIQIELTGLSDNYWIDFDGLRLDAENEYTAVYDLVAYRQITNVNAYGKPVPIVKDANSLNYIEFRFNVAVS